MTQHQGHELGKAGVFSADNRKYHRTNEFLHRASEDLGLSWEEGHRVVIALLRDILRRVPSKTASNLLSNLPVGIKEECCACADGPLKSIGREKMLDDIKLASRNDQVDAQAIARLFWLFLEGELREGPGANKGILRRVLEELPHDIRALLTRKENAV